MMKLCDMCRVERFVCALTIHTVRIYTGPIGGEKSYIYK